MFVAPAAAVDALRFAGDLEALGWANYVFVWLAIHHLGYAWRAGVLSGASRTLSLAAAGLAALVLLMALGPYPVSMVTVPGQPTSNSNPPTLALLALAGPHGGLLLATEPHVQRWLRRPGLWTAVVLVNGSILTVYLWHATAMVLLVGLAQGWGGVTLGLSPGSAGWWVARPPWLAGAGVVLLVFVALLGRFERAGRLAEEAPAPPWRTVLRSVAVCVGLVALGAGGIAGEGPLGVRVWPVALTLAGCALVTLRGRGAPPRRPASSSGRETGTTR